MLENIVELGTNLVKEDEEVEGGKYTEESISKLKEALSRGQKVLGKEDATQEEVNELIKAIGCKAWL